MEICFRGIEGQKHRFLYVKKLRLHRLCFRKALTKKFSPAEQFSDILNKSDIKQRLRTIYVHYRRMVVQILKKGVRYVIDLKEFAYKESWEEEDAAAGENRETRTVKEMQKAMCDVS